MLFPYDTVPQKRSEEQWLPLRLRSFEFLEYIKKDFITEYDPKLEVKQFEVSTRLKTDNQGHALANLSF